jgi:thiamine-monophosphate kinase
MAASGGHELSLIEKLLRRFPQGPQLIAGPGDDAAVVRAAPICVTSVDAAIDGVHFELGEGRYDHADVGFKAVASALSDLAAMGVAPGEAYIVLCIPDGLSETDALAIADGAAEIALATGTTIAGGDVVRAPRLGVSVTVVGWAESDSAPVYRSGAAGGELVGVTGTLGGAGAGLVAMRGEVAIPAQEREQALARARRPEPRIREGICLAAAGARAMIDLSDGLATDAVHLGRASEVSLEIDLSLLPLGPGVEMAAEQLGARPSELAARAGEDYELCFCVPPAERAAVERALAEAGGAGVSWIGETVPTGEAGAGARFTLDGVEIELTGFEHRW